MAAGDFCTSGVRRGISTSDTNGLVMWWFPQRPERAYRQRLRERLAIAQRLTRDVKVRRLATENGALTLVALQHAQEDETVFERLFGESPPLPLQRSLQLERDAWTDLSNNLHQQSPERTRKTLRGIIRVLSIEEEILTSPLHLRFVHALDRVRREDLTTGR